jgi:DNA-binding transcriptional LysR family regulator
MTVDVRHLRAFLMVADVGNITRAAERLHLSQPALSRSLAQLEHQLGVSLVTRSTHHLELTEAGRRFVRAFDDALGSAGASAPPLRLGYTWAASAHAATLAKRWNDRHPDRPLLVRRSEERSAGLAHQLTDVALTRGPLADGRYRTVAVAEESRVAVLPADHRLAGRAELTLADLRHERLVVHSRAGTTTPALWPVDGRPEVVADVAHTDDWLVAIAIGTGVGVSVASTSVLNPHPQVRFVPLVDAPPVTLLMAWPADDPHPDVAELVTLATTARRQSTSDSARRSALRARATANAAARSTTAVK